MGCSQSVEQKQVIQPKNLNQSINNQDSKVDLDKKVQNNEKKINNEKPIIRREVINQPQIVNKNSEQRESNLVAEMPKKEGQQNVKQKVNENSQTVNIKAKQQINQQQQKQQQWKPVPIVPIKKPQFRGFFKKVMYKHNVQVQQIIKPMRQHFIQKYNLARRIQMMKCSGQFLLRDKPFLDLMRLIRKDQFTLKNISQIVHKVFDLYKEDHDAFQIIPHLFCQFFSIKKFKENKSTMEIEVELRQIISKLCIQFPPTVKGQASVTEDVPFPICPQKNVNLFGDNDGTFFQSYQSLLVQMKLVNQKAKASLPRFKELVNFIGQNYKGFGYKSGLKLPQNQYDWFKVLIRVMEKMFPQLKQRKQAIILQAQKKIEQSGKGSMQVVMVSLLDVWVSEIDQILKHRGGKAQFYITDLVRGKCMFKNLFAIKKAVNGVITFCAEKQFQILQLDNRLKKITQDVVFKILVGEIVCQFQLALEFDYTQFQFGHAFYEIDRSPMGSIFGSYLFIGKSQGPPFISTVRDTLHMFKGERKNDFDMGHDWTVQRDEQLIEVLKYIYNSFMESNS